VFHYSDTWQLVINTETTIVTFLMVFLIQNTQNRDARAINLKLNELIRATEAAGDQMMDIESLSDEELDAMHATYERIRAECMERQHRAKRPSRWVPRKLRANLSPSFHQKGHGLALVARNSSSCLHSLRRYFSRRKI
jgi:low affinity Fe/Cu permease